MTGIKVGRGGGDSGRFDQGRAKSRTVSSLFFEAWLLRAERFKGLAYFRSISLSLSLSPPSSSNIFNGVFTLLLLLLLFLLEVRCFDIGLRLRHFVSNLSINLLP